MIIRYIPADPAGNLTAIVLSPVEPQARAEVAARMMARCPEGFEQVGFADEASLTGDLPRLCMMGGEFCGNAARAFACYAAKVRGKGETRLSVAISGAKNPVPVEIDLSSCRAYAQMPLPYALETLDVDGREIPLVRMEGIDHALLLNAAPSPAARSKKFIPPSTARSSAATAAFVPASYRYAEPMPTSLILSPVLRFTRYLTNSPLPLPEARTPFMRGGICYI